MKKQYLYFIYILFILFSLFSCKNKKFTINGKEGYQIVIPSQADSITLKAANELQLYLMKLQKAELPITEESKYKGDNAIYIGRTNYSDAMDINYIQLDTDGYAFKHNEENFIIVGGSGRGVLYGIYDLLEALGFRKYTADYTYIPKNNFITFPNDTIVIPKIKFRQVYYNAALNPDFFDWHKLDDISENWGFFVHTFDRLVPPGKYGEKHPEYYAFYNGKRHVGDGSQLCLSNPEVLDTLINNLRQEMVRKPQMKYWSVSQNDNYNRCQCDLCKKLNEKYGGEVNRHSGSIIHFVNKVAMEFPDKTISTLAYQYSREAPENIELEPNVNIMLCSIESERHKPIPQTDPDFTRDLEDWSKLTKNIFLWDYTVQFSNLVSPFPNIHTLKPNIKFFTDNNVPEMFQQGDRYTGTGGDMIELKTYLIAKLLWNPNADEQAIINDFIGGYYGDAGPYIRQYIDTMRHTLVETDHHLKIFGSPVDAKDTYLTNEMMDEYKRLFDKAENSVAKDPEILSRVQRSRLSIMYAELEIAGSELVDNSRSMYQHTSDGKVIIKPEIKKLVHQFVERCNEHGVIRLKERATPPDVYLGAFNRIFNKMEEMDNAISLHKKIIPITYVDFGRVEALTDGVFGSYESFRQHFNWLGYEGKHMEFIIDLGEAVPITFVNIDFLNGRTLWTPTFLPEYVTYEASLDGKIYSKPIKVLNPNKPNKEDTFNKEILVQSFYANMNENKVRFIKVHAESILNCPTWHMDAGSPAWLFADEIIVK